VSAEIVTVTPGLRARLRRGAGERILWVHGYTIDSSLWQELWERLPDWEHIGPDLPDHGMSAPLDADENLVTLGRELGEWARDNGVRHVVGLSLGSTIALQIVLSFPQAFESLTLGAPALGGGPVEASVGVRYVELLRMLEQIGPGPWLANRWMTSPPDLFTYARKHPALWHTLQNVIARHGWAELPGFQIARLATWPQRLADVAAIRARLLLLIGEHEMPAFVETARILEATVAGSRSVVLPGCGHLCMLEEPDRSALEIGAHLSNKPAAQGSRPAAG
jgi:2-succinyl-6-hydroxy-2,4-cyclohexadiene-1-carboxylate synthase